MKTFFTRILSTALCFILAFAVIQPAFAEGTDDFVDYDAPYIAFLQQTNPDGVTNEEEIEAAKQRAFDAFDGIILGPTNDGWSHISPIFTGGYYVETARFWYQYQCLPGNTKSDLSPFARIFTARSMFPVRPFSKSRLMQTAARISPPLSLTTAQALHRFS